MGEQQGEVSWAEVALAFQAATHTGLSRDTHAWDTETMRTRAKIMPAGSRTIAQTCKEEFAPAKRKASSAWVGALQGLGFGTVCGIQARPVLMERKFVQEVLLQEAVRAVIGSTEASLDFVPDMAGIGDALWTYRKSEGANENKKERSPRQARPKSRCHASRRPKLLLW